MSEDTKTGAPVDLTTRLLVRELSDGTCIAFPVVDPSLASFGSEEDALTEQELFLREYLARSAPDVLARFAVPAGTRLEEIAIVLPREDLPRRMRVETPITLPCIVLPAQNDRWVSVPALGHVFFVAREEDLIEVTRSEVRRVVGARDLTPYEQSRLLPASAHRLETVVVPLDRREGPQSVGGASMKKAITDHARRARAAHTLNGVGTPLHAEHRTTSPPLVGRESERQLLASLLNGRTRLSALLVGPEHAGKSALLRAWLAGEHAKGNEPLVYQTSGAQLIAGMSGFGQWQERVRNVMDAIETLDAILYFDDLSDLLAERVEGGVDIAGAMKHHLEEGKVRFVAELRSEGLDLLETRHWALFGCLNKVKVEPLSAARTREALDRRVAHDARHDADRPQLDPAAVAPLVDLAERYLPYGAFPGKAIQLYEDLRAVREARHDATADAPIRVDDVYELFSLKTGVPGFLLREATALSVADVALALKKQVIGQDEAVQSLAHTVGVVKAGLQPPGKPLATFLFVGPTGVGKTELARSLALYLFGSAERMVRFDMSEFMSADAAERLIRGTDRDAGLLTRKVREQPFCVLLLDEIEKAHPSVFDLLLQVTGEGRLTDARGKTAYFQNAILIMTSNLGAGERRAEVGFTGGRTPDAAYYQKHVESNFRQEFVNRIDRVVAFRSLSRDDVRLVAGIGVERIKARRGFVDLGVGIEVSESALSRFAEEGYSDTYGARALRRHLEERLVVPVARLLGGLGADAKETIVNVELETEPAVKREGALVSTSVDHGVRFTVRGRRASKLAREILGVSDLSEVRREIDLWMRLPSVEQVSDQLDSLVTQLNHADLGKRDRRKEHDVAELLAEHHRLSDVMTRARAAQSEVHSCEELAFMALLEGQEVAPFLEDARGARSRVRRVLPYVLVALEPHRDEITLILEELDDGAFAMWLAPLLAELPRRRWSATLHLDSTERLKSDGEWPASRRWGPPRTTEWAENELSIHKKLTAKNVLFRCRGPFAGVFLALEAGLHRIITAPREKGEGAGGKDDSRFHTYVHFVAMRASIKDDEEWKHKSLNPPPPESRDARKRGRANRESNAPDGVVTLVGGRRSIDLQMEAYWSAQEEIALEHLLLFETETDLDRDDLFSPRGA